MTKTTPMNDTDLMLKFSNTVPYSWNLGCLQVQRFHLGAARRGREHLPRAVIVAAERNVQRAGGPQYLDPDITHTASRLPESHYP